MSDTRRFAVSVVMPVRNGERYLAAALDSLLEQSVPPDEILVIDDGSTDATPTLLRSYGSRITIITQPPVGIFAAMNRGIERASGSVLGFLDADDVAPRQAYEGRLLALGAGPQVDAVTGRMTQFISPDVAAEVATRYRVDPAPVLAPSFSATLFRRSAFDRVGLLDETRRTGSTIDWLSRARSLGLTFGEIDDLVLHRRVHGGNIGALEPDVTRQNLLEVVRAHRHRRREVEQ